MTTRIDRDGTCSAHWLPWMFAAVVALGVACGGEGTTGKNVILHTRIVSDLPADHTVTTSMGWTVTLKKAVIASGPLYYYDGEPAFVRAPGGRVKRFFAALSPIANAWAHPGHYLAGNARGQMLAPFSFDVLAGPTALPDGSGISGLTRSATFSFAAPSAGPGLAALSGHVAYTEGSATKDGKTVTFVLTADLADIAKTAKDAQITGCAFKEVEVEADGTVTITVKPRIWFGLVDFAELPPGTPERPTIVDAGATAHVGFALGLGQLSAYAFEYAPTAPDLSRTAP